jgi:hypothetical protein
MSGRRRRQAPRKGAPTSALTHSLDSLVIAGFDPDEARPLRTRVCSVCVDALGEIATAISYRTSPECINVRCPA